MISIIVPVYNVEKYINRCIESILKQSYKDFELILVDDGSTDSSPKICDSYAEKYSNVITIHKQNEGLGLTRNKGIEYCSGDHILFVDSDDTIHIDTLQTLYNYASEGFDTIISGYLRVDENDLIIGKFSYEEACYNTDDIKNSLIPKMIGSLPNKSDSIAVSSCGVLYSKDIIFNHKIRFLSEKEVISEDLIFNLDYLIRAKRVKVTQDTLYNYRLTEGSLTKKYNKKRFEMIKELYLLERKYLDCYSILQLSDLRLKKQFFIYLRMCFRQERKDISGFNKEKSLSNILEMCSDPFVLNVISEYPIKMLHYPQRLFIYMVKFKCVKLLYFFIELGLIN